MSDLIKRKDVIDVIKAYDFKFPQYMERFVTELRDAMKADLQDDLSALPSAEITQKDIEEYCKPRCLTVITNDLFEHLKQGMPSAQQWIPCSEWISDDEVLCINAYNTYMVGYVYANYRSNTGYVGETDGMFMWDVVAWCELPEPWEGEKE